MTARPIIFSGPMVQALLAGRKTQTRRVAWGKERRLVKDAEHYDVLGWSWREDAGDGLYYGAPPSLWQRVQPGDRLWVRETHYVWVAHQAPAGGSVILYRADTPYAPTAWTPSIHMPRWASRLTLVVTATRIERLQEITKADVAAEGITEREGKSLAGVVAGWHEPFADLWDSLHGDGSWDANPAVVVVTFTVHQSNADA